MRKRTYYECDLDGCSKPVKKAPSLREQFKGKKGYCSQEHQWASMHKPVHIFCERDVCQNVVIRNPGDLERGRDLYCSKPCRYGHNASSKNPGVSQGKVLQLCCVCGTKVFRPPSQADAFFPTCSEEHRKINQGLRRGTDQLVYTPELLQYMQEYMGEGCAFPGCESPRATSDRYNFRNSYKACEEHKYKISNALKQRALVRKKML